jgi:ribosomal protein S18 acetylase RimI-like enzyme
MAGNQHNGAGVVIRHGREKDRPRLNQICLLTGDAGADASAQEDDPALLGKFFVEPYIVFAPEFSFVAEIDGALCGYAVGVPDSAAFAAWMAKVWLPPLREGRADPGPDRASWTGSDWLRRVVHHPPAVPLASLAGFPAHGHINLLPAAQGHGLGRTLLTRVMTALGDAGAEGIHLGVQPENRRALQFYERLGFRPIAVPEEPGTTYLGRPLP